MTLYRYFSGVGVAVAVALVTGLSGCGNSNNNSYNEWADHVPEEGKNITVLRERQVLADRLLTESPENLLNCRNVVVHDNEAEKSGAERLCAWAAAARQQQPEMVGFQLNYRPPGSYPVWEEGRMKRVMEAMAADPLVANAYARWKTPGAYEDEQDAKAQYDMKRLALQAVADHIRRGFGLPPVPVFLHKFPADKALKTGRYHSAENYIGINYLHAEGQTDSFEGAVEALLHETKHSVDFDTALAFFTGAIKAHDVRAPHAAAIWLSVKNPVRIKRDLFGEADKSFFRVYREQYLERSAADFADKHAPALERKLSCRAAETLLPCLEGGFGVKAGKAPAPQG